MRKETIKILLVSILLLTLAFFVGCKDEAEAKEDVWLTIEPNEPEEPTFELVPCSTDPTADRLIWMDDEWPPKIIKVYQGEKVYEYVQRIEPNEPDLTFDINGGDLTLTTPKVTYTAEELDEIYKDEPALGRLAKDLYGVGEGRILLKEDLQRIIPTWPEYIELDKDLVIDMPSPMWYGANAFKTFEFPKGTKIYFKDD